MPTALLVTRSIAPIEGVFRAPSKAKFVRDRGKLSNERGFSAEQKHGLPSPRSG